MVQIGNVPEIIEVKDKLDALKNDNLVSEWELPYENLLTRRNAAIFFISTSSDSNLEKIWSELEKIDVCVYKENTDKLLSKLPWQVQFGEQEENTETLKVG